MASIETMLFVPCRLIYSDAVPFIYFYLYQMMLTRIIPEVPSETARLARSLFNAHNLYLQVGDALCAITADFGPDACANDGALNEQAAHLLALITMFQFVEMLTDRQANEAIRQRLDWKYALHLPISFPSAPHLQTCEFRRKLLAHPTEMERFQAMLTRMKRQGMPSAAPTTPTGSLISASHVVRTVCALNRLDRLVEAFVIALEYLAAYHSDWLLKHTQPGWYLRYGRASALRTLPPSSNDWPARFELVGNDGHKLLEAIYTAPTQPGSPNPIAAAPQVQALQRELCRQFLEQDGRLHMCVTSCVDCDTHAIRI